MKKIIALLLVLVLLTGCRTELTPPTQPPAAEPLEESLFVHFIDVGQADCTLLKVGDLEILIDGGNTEDGWYVTDYLTRLGVDDIELMIATHAHEDHYGGLSDVLRRFSTETLWVTDDPYAYSYYGRFLDTAEDRGTDIVTPELGTVFSQNGLRITVLGPVKDYSTSDTNDTSLVVKVTYGDRDFLFTGDMERAAEKDLVASGADLSADVLKVGHHGSYTSSGSDFLQAVGAEYGIIHVGRDNEYGHPHSDALRRLTAAGLTLYRTDLCRDLVVATDGDQLVFLFTDAPAAQTQPDLLPEGEHLTVAQAILLCQQVGDRETVENYYLTGTVTEIANNTYGNLYLTDETGTIYVYGVSGPDGELDWTSLPHRPQVGDRVTLYGSLILYRNEMPELKNAWLVEEMEE